MTRQSESASAGEAPAPGRRPHRPLATAMAVAALLAASTVPVFAGADLPGEASGTLAAVFPPGTGKPEVLAGIGAAGGTIVRGGGWNSVLVVHSEEAGFARRLRQAGAWLVVDPRSAAGCLITAINPAPQKVET